MTRDDQFGITGDSGEPCKNGKVGICGTPSSCKTSTVTGACNGGSDNVCCSNLAPTWHNPTLAHQYHPDSKELSLPDVS